MPSRARSEIRRRRIQFLPFGPVSTTRLSVTLRTVDPVENRSATCRGPAARKADPHSVPAFGHGRGSNVRERRKVAYRGPVSNGTDEARCAFSSGAIDLDTGSWRQVIQAAGSFGGEFACLFVLGRIHDLAIVHGIGVFDLGELDQRDYGTGAITLARGLTLLCLHSTGQDRRECDHDDYRSFE